MPSRFHWSIWGKRGLWADWVVLGGGDLGLKFGCYPFHWFNVNVRLAKGGSQRVYVVVFDVGIPDPNFQIGTTGYETRVKERRV